MLLHPTDENHMTKERDGLHCVGFDVECGKDVQVVGGGP